MNLLFAYYITIFSNINTMKIGGNIMSEESKGAEEKSVIVIDISLDNKTTEQLEQSANTIDKFENSLKKTRDQLNKIGSSRSEIPLELRDRASQTLEKIKHGLNGIVEKTWNIILKIKDFVTTPARKVFNFLEKSVTGFVSKLKSLGKSFQENEFINFEYAMSGVQATAGASLKDMELLNEKAKKIGATTAFTSEQAAKAFQSMGQTGWKAQAMNNSLDAFTYLTIGSGKSIDSVSNVMTSGMSAFKLSPEEKTKVKDKNGIEKEVDNAMYFADILAATATNSNTDILQLGQAFKYCAPLAANLGFSVEDTALAVGLLGNNGIKASSAGTALRRIFTELAGGFEIAQSNGEKFRIETENADGSMRSLKDILDDIRVGFNGMSQEQLSAVNNDLSDSAELLGVSLEHENGVLKTQAELYNDVMKASEGLTEAGRIQEANAIAGKTAMSGLLSLVSASDKSYNKLAESIYNADGAVKRMNDTMLDNCKGAFTLLQSSISDVKIMLGEKFAPYLKSFIEWITSKMPAVKKTLGVVADFITGKIDKAKESIEKFNNLGVNLSFFGKIKVAWDEVIARPFSNWWNSKGLTWANEKAGQIGKAIGNGLKTGILALLGINIDKTGNEGYSIGSSFAKGFLEGFEASKVWDALKQKISEMFSSALKILPAGEKADGGSWLSAAILGYGSLKIAGGIMNAGKGISSLANVFNPVTAAASTSTSALATAGASGIGNLAIGASLLSFGSLAGGALGAAGIFSGVKDAHEGNKARGMAKMGMVGAGATIGTIILPGAGTLIGAGIGGIGALLTDSVWKTENEKEAEAIEKRITAEKEKQEKLYKNMQDMQGTRLALQYTNDSIYETEQLYKRWNDIKWELKQGNLTEQQRLEKEYAMQEALQKLANMYPNLINASDLENNNLKSKLDLIQDMNAEEKERLRMKLLLAATESREKRSETIQDLQASDEKIQGLKMKVDEIEYGDASLKLGHLSEQYQIFEEQRQQLLKTTGGSMSNKEYREAVENKEFIADQIKSVMENYGVTDQTSYSIENLDSMSEALNIAKKGLLENLVAEYQNNELLKGSLQEAYETELKLIELDIGKPIDEAAASFEEMDVKQKIAFLTAIKKVQELNDEFDKMPDKKYTEIIVQYSTENGVTPSSENPPKDPPLVELDKFATGGIVDSPHIGLVGEAGAEAIIPLTGSNKKYGVKLWEQAGEYLGMFSDKITAHAKGGIFGVVDNKPQKSYTNFLKINDTRLEESAPISASPTLSQPITLILENVNFSVTANDNQENVIKTINRHLPEVADSIAGEIANGLKYIFPNMKKAY